MEVTLYGQHGSDFHLMDPWGQETLAGLAIMFSSNKKNVFLTLVKDRLKAGHLVGIGLLNTASQ